MIVFVVENIKIMNNMKECIFKITICSTASLFASFIIYVEHICGAGLKKKKGSGLLITSNVQLRVSIANAGFSKRANILLLTRRKKEKVEGIGVRYR